MIDFQLHCAQTHCDKHKSTDVEWKYNKQQWSKTETQVHTQCHFMRWTLLMYPPIPPQAPPPTPSEGVKLTTVL